MMLVWLVSMQPTSASIRSLVFQVAATVGFYLLLSAWLNVQLTLTIFNT